MRTYPSVIISALVALAMNIGLDAYTEFPMLLRWVLAIGAGLLVSVVLNSWPKNRPRHGGRSRTNETQVHQGD